jgi:hypothetical protein
MRPPLRLMLLISATLIHPVPLIAADVVLLDPGSRSLRGGRSGFVAEVQAKMNQLPEDCRPIPRLTPDGQFGAGTRAAIARAASCTRFADVIPADSPARKGVLTETLWIALFPNRPIPSAHERAMVIVLTQEATDYDRAEWNFCQSRPAYDPSRGQNVCFSNDPRSYLTWGPRGATAGHGAEIQQIVHAIDSDPRTKPVLDSSFGTLAGSLRRLIRLDESDTVRFLCAEWMDPARRLAWKDAFRTFGSSAEVVRVYDTVYASAPYDGGKIERYFRLYDAAGIAPNEVDYGFMLDRATHMGAPSQVIIDAATKAMSSAGPQRKAAELRRWLALNHRPSNQQTDRMGRDVVFYVDALESLLTTEERTAWTKRNLLRASQVGLRESVAVPVFRAPLLAFPKVPRGEERLTENERNACPTPVLNPRSP